MTKTPSSRRSAMLLGLFLGLCFGAAAMGSLLTRDAIPTWYAGLRKPDWNPPNWIFGPVWTALYAMMAVAAWMIARSGAPRARTAVALFFAQLVLNVAWSGLFFYLRRPAAALVEIAILWFAILATIFAFWRIRRAAGALLLPYLAWVGFAAALNAALWTLNR